MHNRYEHVTESEEALRILRKHGYESEEGGDAVEQRECPRCGTIVDQFIEYCPSCSLRQRDERPRWWQIYRDLVDDSDPIMTQYSDDLPPASLAQLPPAYYEHVLDVYSSATVVAVLGSLPGDFDAEEFAPDSISDHLVDDIEMDSDDIDWLNEEYPEIEERQQEQHPGSRKLRSDD